MESLIAECDEYWTSLIWMLSGQDKTQYDALGNSDIFDFFRLLKIHEKDQIRKIKQLNKIQNGKNNIRPRK